MARRTDTTQPVIVAALRGVGAQVVDLHLVGNGVPDLMVYWHNRVYLLEVKSPGGRIKPMQQQFLATWKAVAHVVYSPQEALETIGAVEKGSCGA